MVSGEVAVDLAEPGEKHQGAASGKKGGIMRTSSSRIRVKCALAVKKSMVERAQRAAVCQGAQPFDPQRSCGAIDHNQYGHEAPRRLLPRASPRNCR